MAGTKPSVSAHFKQSNIGLSVRLAAEIKVCTFDGSKFGVHLMGENCSFLEELFSSKNLARIDR